MWNPETYLDPTKTYMARIKLRRSMTGSRDYSFEKSSTNVGVRFGSSSAYVENGGRGMRIAGTKKSYTPLNYGFDLPQNPRLAPHYKENFVMYSRPSAFGPPIAGVGRNPADPNDPHVVNAVVGDAYSSNTVFDSFNGNNPA